MAPFIIALATYLYFDFKLSTERAESQVFALIAFLTLALGGSLGLSIVDGNIDVSHAYASYAAGIVAGFAGAFIRHKE